jgi:2'-5' RNA ligase
MARRRLGVVLLVSGRAAIEIDGMRRACGDRALERVPPHVTLIPPVNVSETRVPEALTRLRDAAARTSPFTLELGPVTSFQPDSPTLYLAVGGAPDDLAALHALRDAMFEPPLHRELTWPFVPHVTLADEIPAERIEAAVTALSDYRTTVECGSVHLLQEQRDDGQVRWHPIADYHFRAPIPVARGSLPLDLWISDGLDPESRQLVDAEETVPRADSIEKPAGWRRLTVSARRRGETVGIATGYTDGSRSRLSELVVAPAHRGQGIARHLYAWFVAEGGPAVDSG